jgi:hypothetical protein
VKQPVSEQRVITLNPQVMGNVGLYYCCYKLSLLGWNVMPTARNARGVDIIAYSGDACRFIGVQVKSLTRRNPVPLGPNLDRCMGHFWIVVTSVASSPTAFVMSPEQVKERAHRGERDGRVSFWLQPVQYDRDEFREAWHRIGYGDSAPPQIDAVSTEQQTATAEMDE